MQKEPKNCPVCQIIVSDWSGRPRFNIEDYVCPVCGRFGITRSAKINFRSKTDDKRAVAIVSHAVRKMQERNEWPTIDSKMIKQLLKQDYLPTPSEQADNYILWVGDSTQFPGREIEIIPKYQWSIIGALDQDNFTFIHNSLYKKGLLTVTQKSTSLSFDGWSEYNILKTRIKDSYRAFMAMPFGDSLLDKVFFEFFKPAVKKTGLDLVRLDEAPRAGLIDDRLRVSLRSAKLIIAELTNGNNGAYWEAGFAEGLGKPVIYTCERGYFNEKKTHFDTNHMHTVIWDQDNLEEAAQNLKASIRATIPRNLSMKMGHLSETIREHHTQVWVC